VHACPQQIRSAKHAPSPENDSNRGQRENQIYSNKSLGYVWSVGKRWDTSDILYYFMLFRLRSSRPSFKENQEVVQLRTFSDLLVFATRIAGPWMTPVDD
jgi:hypothetical protein